MRWATLLLKVPAGVVNWHGFSETLDELNENFDRVQIG